MGGKTHGAPSNEQRQPQDYTTRYLGTPTLFPVTAVINICAPLTADNSKSERELLARVALSKISFDTVTKTSGAYCVGTRQVSTLAKYCGTPCVIVRLLHQDDYIIGTYSHYRLLMRCLQVRETRKENDIRGRSTSIIYEQLICCIAFGVAGHLNGKYNTKIVINALH